MNIFYLPRKYINPCYFVLFSILLFSFKSSSPQKKSSSKHNISHTSSRRVFYGLASFYNDKFNGRKTANGDIFRQRKLTCACNMLPFGTLLKVTNMRNGKSVVVKVNDRLHVRMRRIADFSKAAARKLGFTTSGLVRVRMEVIGRRNRR